MLVHLTPQTFFFLWRLEKLSMIFYTDCFKIFSLQKYYFSAFLEAISNNFPSLYVFLPHKWKFHSGRDQHTRIILLGLLFWIFHNFFNCPNYWIIITQTLIPFRTLIFDECLQVSLLYYFAFSSI